MPTDVAIVGQLRVDFELSEAGLAVMDGVVQEGGAVGSAEGGEDVALGKRHDGAVDEAGTGAAPRAIGLTAGRRDGGCNGSAE